MPCRLGSVEGLLGYYDLAGGEHGAVKRIELAELQACLRMRIEERARRFVPGDVRDSVLFEIRRPVALVKHLPDEAVFALCKGEDGGEDLTEEDACVHVRYELRLRPADGLKEAPRLLELPFALKTIETGVLQVKLYLFAAFRDPCLELCEKRAVLVFHIGFRKSIRL